MSGDRGTRKGGGGVRATRAERWGGDEQNCQHSTHFPAAGQPCAAEGAQADALRPRGPVTPLCPHPTPPHLAASAEAHASRTCRPSLGPTSTTRTKLPPASELAARAPAASARALARRSMCAYATGVGGSVEPRCEAAQMRRCVLCKCAWHCWSAGGHWQQGRMFEDAVASSCSRRGGSRVCGHGASLPQRSGRGEEDALLGLGLEWLKLARLPRWLVGPAKDPSTGHGECTALGYRPAGEDGPGMTPSSFGRIWPSVAAVRLRADCAGGVTRR